jgi:hypothetical protein
VNDLGRPFKLIDEISRFAAICNTFIGFVLHMAPLGMKFQELLGTEVKWNKLSIILVEKRR